MKRLLSTINKRPNASPSRDEYPQDSPESIILKEVTAFCEKGQGPNQPQGDEFVHLPTIVESAESSPNAAREAAHLLRKLLSSPNSTAANIQYNALMLIRILIDNPGHTFSRNLDAKFVATVKDVLRTEKDLGVQRFLRETLDSMEMQRGWDEDLKPLVEMWKKEKAKMDKTFNVKSRSNSWRSSVSRQNSDTFVRHERVDTLPPPDELVARISEAKTTAKLLMQFVQSTPPTEMLSNDLIQEFSARSRRAQRAISNYVHATNPPPDEDTLLTLIETNDELSVALSKHQRAMLQARKALGQQTPPAEPTTAEQSPEPSEQPTTSATASRPVPPPPVPLRTQIETPPLVEPVSPVSPERGPQRNATTKTEQSDTSMASGTGTGGRYEYRSEDYQVQNPFADNYSIPSTIPAHAADDDEREVERERWNMAQQPAQQHPRP
ncbi:uncharacterized protein DSM5745_01802 [Aspergillus mulundensis]|uniref:GAT domain-containing protein n=1 Tax=Aspergillus mulundensis TaxID=1810919 RepID=A0A3D8SUN1_9EURO|nr:Uncharacterized protein DSM5745_01802 [Aspergillus mulundensis]RDW90027.1 Uncharacterized protein DSM5745_01802 [Aspergillus mulundensis]